ncbi:MAG TPA: hypothetical protein PLE45_03720 [Spirochaetota bacterium]|nr:hypothetical protein [Spirochaetota bacterium]HOL56371.1 hypothetical protein [Spirochaetota bacterium]HPP03654.1 hypothetical protein [Spirochaetota bacterium]
MKKLIALFIVVVLGLSVVLMPACKKDNATTTTTVEQPVDTTSDATADAQ